MIPKNERRPALQVLFKRRIVVNLRELFDTLDTRSRMSVFRRLKEVGYFTSYTHTGRYYTLANIPAFDSFGLWYHQSVGFSQFGTLKATIVHLVDDAEAGCTHAELEEVLRLRVFNTLLLLVKAGEIQREVIGEAYCYMSVDKEQCSRQIDARRQRVAQEPQPSPIPPDDVVLLVIVETLHASDGLPIAPVVAARLTARGEDVTTAQVEQVFKHFGFEPGKKTVGPR